MNAHKYMYQFASYIIAINENREYELPQNDIYISLDGITSRSYKNATFIKLLYNKGILKFATDNFILYREYNNLELSTTPGTISSYIRTDLQDIFTTMASTSSFITLPNMGFEINILTKEKYHTPAIIDNIINHFSDNHYNNGLTALIADRPDSIPTELLLALRERFKINDSSQILSVRYRPIIEFELLDRGVELEPLGDEVIYNSSYMELVANLLNDYITEYTKNLAKNFIIQSNTRQQFIEMSFKIFHSSTSIDEINNLIDEISMYWDTL